MFDLSNMSLTDCDNLLIKIYPVVNACKTHKASLFDAILAMHGGDMRKVNVTMSLAKEEKDALGKVKVLFELNTYIKDHNLYTFPVKTFNFGNLDSENTEKIIRLIPPASVYEVEDFLQEEGISLESLEALQKELYGKSKFNKVSSDLTDRSEHICEALTSSEKDIFCPFAKRLIDLSRIMTASEFDEVFNNISIATRRFFSNSTPAGKNGTRVIHPGKALSKILGARGVSITQFSKMTGILENDIRLFIDEELLLGDIYLEPISKALGMTMEYWVGLRDSYIAEKSEDR